MSEINASRRLLGGQDDMIVIEGRVNIETGCLFNGIAVNLNSDDTAALFMTQWFCYLHKCAARIYK